MDWEVLIPILMFLFPLVAALLDKRARKRKGAPPVIARPVFPSASDVSASRPSERPAAQDPSQPYGWAPPTYDAEGGTVPKGRPAETVFKMQKDDLPPVEGQRAIVRRIQEVEEIDPRTKLEIDKKKLILYSEILKPKFDD